MRNAVLLTLAVLSTSGCYVGVNAPPTSSSGSLTIDNASSHVLTEVRVTGVNESSWGPNLLPDVLYPDERLTVDVACNTYDVLVTDEHGRECTLLGQDLCFSDQIWVIDNSTLRNCNF